MKTRTLFAVIPLLLIQGCQSLELRPADQFLKRHEIPPPNTDRFTACEKFGCASKAEQSYSAAEWRRIEALFTPPPASPADERRTIGQAIALMETLVGTKNNTAGDVARNGGWLVGSPQLDCVAETINTTVALTLLEQNGLLQHHTVGYPRHRGFLDLTGPHYSAALYDKSNRQSYVVDSWFFDNGQQPVIIKAEKWQKGYTPED